MGFWNKLLIALLLAAAYKTNPEEDSFRNYLERELKRMGSSWLEQKLISQMSKALIERTDYQLFCTVRLQTPESLISKATMDNPPSNSGLLFLGVLGYWIPLSSLNQFVQSMKS